MRKVLKVIENFDVVETDDAIEIYNSGVTACFKFEEHPRSIEHHEKGSTNTFGWIDRKKAPLSFLQECRKVLYIEPKRNRVLFFESEYDPHIGQLHIYEDGFKKVSRYIAWNVQSSNYFNAIHNFRLTRQLQQDSLYAFCEVEDEEYIFSTNLLIGDNEGVFLYHRYDMDPVKSFYGVKKWDRVLRTHEQYAEVYNFFILHIGGFNHIVLNLQTFQNKTLCFVRALPVSDFINLNTNYVGSYIVKGEQFLCTDVAIYDKDMTEYLYYPHQEEPVLVLDTIGKCLAIQNGEALQFYYIDKYKIKQNKFPTKLNYTVFLKDTCYRISMKVTSDTVGSDLDYFDYFYFNLDKKKFELDTEEIKEYLEICSQRKVYDDGHYGLMDAFDGDMSMYLNID